MTRYCLVYLDGARDYVDGKSSVEAVANRTRKELPVGITDLTLLARLRQPASNPTPIFDRAWRAKNG